MITQLAPAQFSAWVRHHHAAGDMPLLIDVREPWEWQLASLPPQRDCELLQLAMGDVPAELNRLDPDRPTALLCHHGVRSQHVAQFLLANGFTDLANVAGGIDAWARSADPQVPCY